jgi:hypothetical protein
MSFPIVSTQVSMLYHLVCGVCALTNSKHIISLTSPGTILSEINRGNVYLPLLHWHMILIV